MMKGLKQLSIGTIRILPKSGTEKATESVVYLAQQMTERVALPLSRKKDKQTGAE